jgi:hypothetical protein
MFEVHVILLILLYKYGVNFTASMIIIFKLTIIILNIKTHVYRDKLFDRILR